MNGKSLDMSYYGILTVIDQAMYLVGLGMDPMMGIGLGSCSLDYLDLLGTWIGPCSRKAKPRQTQTFIVSRVGIKHSLS